MNTLLASAEPLITHHTGTTYYGIESPWYFVLVFGTWIVAFLISFYLAHIAYIFRALSHVILVVGGICALLLSYPNESHIQKTYDTSTDQAQQWVSERYGLKATDSEADQLIAAADENSEAGKKAELVVGGQLVTPYYGEHGLVLFQNAQELPQVSQ